MQSTIAVLACLLAVTAAMPQLGRIVGGSEMTRGQAPHQVSLRTRMNQHFCGGALLSQNWILTSAHCVSGRHPEEIMAVAGSVNLREGNGLNIVNIFVHPEFSADGLVNDIAVVQTESNFSFNLIVQPVQIGGAYVEEHLEAMLTGWGQTTYPGNLAEDLHGINMFTITNEECVEKHAESEGAPQIRETNICAVSAEGAGACLGDSGSALVANRQIIGLVSWGVPCAQGLPDVFTRVSFYRDWIVATIAGN